MIPSDTSALFTALATDRTDLAWSALPDAPVVDDSRATGSPLTAASRVVRQLLPQRRPACGPCATPALR
jgi:hypothetical protein